MQYTELLRELHSLKGATLVTFHSLGDVEAVASAIAVSKLLHNTVVKSPDHTNSASRHLLQALHIEKIPVLKPSEVSQFKNVVLVDVANKEMLSDFGEELTNFKGKVIAIDHHEHGKLLKNAKVFEFPNRTSCCEIIYDLYRISKRKVDHVIATLLLAGLISDTARFKTANQQTFQVIPQLLIASGRKYEDVLQMIKPVQNSSEVKAVLNAMQNVDLIETG
ncbi:MAG: DHH family phosphoesterase, partial [Candidatus Micrarchaeota archaeon]